MRRPGAHRIVFLDEWDNFIDKLTGKGVGILGGITITPSSGRRQSVRIRHDNQHGPGATSRHLRSQNLVGLAMNGPRLFGIAEPMTQVKHRQRRVRSSAHPQARRRNNDDRTPGFEPG